MVKALASRWTRGARRVGLSLALGTSWPLALLAQPGPAAAPAPRVSTAPPSGGSPKPAATPKADEAVPAKAEEENAPAVYKDPRADAIVKNADRFKPIKFTGVHPPQNLVESWAQGNGGVIDKNQLDAHARHVASLMTGPKILSGLASKNLAENEAALKQIERAFELLMKPVELAVKAGRKDFLQSYSQSLLKVMPELLQNHLYARIEGMIVLSRTGDQSTIPTFVEQLLDRNQVAMVKLLAAHGITNVAKSNKALNGNLALVAARALNDFLNAEPDVVWPAQYRALEALGYLRQPSVNPVAAKTEMIDTAARILADPKARPEIRVWAAWAIGMMLVNPNAKVPYPQVVSRIGHLAVELGEKILAVDSPNPEDQAHDLIALLAVPLFNSLNGEPDLVNSGILNSRAIGDARPFTAKLRDLIKAEAKDAVSLGRTPPGFHNQARRELTARVGAVKDFLSQNPQRVGVASGEGESPVVGAAGVPGGGAPRGR